MLKLIIFDFFDVFRTDGYKAWLKAHNLERTGPYAEVSQLSDANKLSSEEFFARLTELSGEPVTAEIMDANTTVNTELIELAEQIHYSYKTALLSNSPSDFIRRIINENDIERLFNHVFISGETGYLKPHSEAFENVLRTMGVDASETLFIDDNPQNVAAAIELGIQGIVFTDVNQLQAELEELNITY